MTTDVPPKSRLPTIVREGFWVGAGQAGTAIATVVGLKLLTTLMTPKAYGELTLVLGLGTLCLSFFGNPFLYSVLRFYPEAAGAGEVGALRRLGFHYLSRSTAVGAGALLTVGLVWSARTGSWSWLAAFALAALALAGDVWRLFEINLLNAARRQAQCSLRMFADAWVRPAGAIACVLVFGATPVAVLAAYAAGSLAITFALRHNAVRGGTSESEPSWFERTRERFVAYALPLAPMAVLNWTLSLSDRYILLGLSNAAAVGVYAAAYGLGSQPFIVMNSFVLTTLRPVLYDAVANGQHDKERKVLWVWLGATLGISATGVALFALLARWVTGLVVGPQFQGAAALIPWIAGAYALQNVQQTFEIMMYSHGQTRRLVVLQTIASVSGLTFYALLIPRYGAMGAAVGTLCAFVVTCASGFVLAGAYRRLGRP